MKGVPSPPAVPMRASADPSWRKDKSIASSVTDTMKAKAAA